VSSVSLAAVLGDQAEQDLICGCHKKCHQCWVETENFVHTSRVYELKNSASIRQKIVEKSAGVVDFHGPAGQRRVIGTKAAYNQAVQALQGHQLLANPFREIAHFDVNQQCMRDPLHTLDLGVSLTLLRGAVKLFIQVQRKMGVQENADELLLKRLNMNMSNYPGPNGQNLRGQHDTMISLPQKLRRIFSHFIGKRDGGQEQSDVPSGVRACDIRNLMLMMPFIMEGLISDQVEHWNRQNHHDEPIEDPSRKLIHLFNLYLGWYSLFRKESKDVFDLETFHNKGKQLIDDASRVFPWTKKMACHGYAMVKCITCYIFQVTLQSGEMLRTCLRNPVNRHIS
jgi:hypothetical protein